MAQPPGGIPLDKEAVFTLAQQEMEYRVGLFNGLLSNCFDKCVESKYKDNDLNLGETSCVDRCVAKYWQVTGIVGQLLGASRPGM